MSFAPDGKTILTGSADGTAKLWDTASGQLLHTFQNNTGSIYSVSYASDGKTILTGSGDGIAKLWDTASGQLLRTFQSNTSGLLSVSFAPDGKTVITGNFDGTVALWDTASGQLLRLLCPRLLDNIWLLIGAALGLMPWIVSFARPKHGFLHKV
ncbi:MAG: hypothetical protein ABI947_05800 [Chloroflexota bacterium]